MNTCTQERTQKSAGAFSGSRFEQAQNLIDRHVNNHNYRKYSYGDRSFNTPMLVVIDPAVEEAQKLATGVKKGTKVLILDRQQDSIKQIALALQENSKFSSVHLVCHGSPGQLYLGSSWLSLQTIERYAEQLKLWSNKLSGASLSIYGCQVADGEKGRIFLQRLHHLTSANIAASTQKVGNAKRGGNWQLDYQIGQFEQAIAFTPELTQTYSGVFIPRVSFTTSPDVIIESEATLFTFRFELSEPPPNGGVTVAVSGDVPQSLSQLDVFNIQVEGADFPQDDENMNQTGFTVNITSQVATVSLPGFQDGQDEENYDVTYTLAPGSGYTVDPNANASSVTFVDTPEEVPDDVPVVGITAEPTTLIEGENTATTLTFNLNEPPPSGGVEVTVDSETANALAEFNVSDASFEGAQLVTANDDSSGFTVRITQQNATIDLPVFNDDRNEGTENLTFSLQTDEGYEINSDASSVTFTLEDNDSGVPTNSTVYRFYNTQTGVHFYTASQEERDTVMDTYPQFRYEGESFETVPVDPLTGVPEEGTPIYRFYNEITQSHFYTSSEEERNNVLDTYPQFNDEGIAYYGYNTQQPGSIELHRFYNPETQAHFYTPSAQERDAVIETFEQFNYEGVGYYVNPLDTSSMASSLTVI